MCSFLREVEVRKFFDSASTSNLVDDPLSHDLDITSFQSRPSTDNRRISQVKFQELTNHLSFTCTSYLFPLQLRQLSLVTSDDYDLIPSETQELHGKYTSVSAILKLVLNMYNFV